MPKPTPPSQGYSFTDHSTNNPTTPQPGASLDSELAAIRTFCDEIITFLDTGLDDGGNLRAATVDEPQLVSDFLDGYVDTLTQDAANSAASSASSASSASAHETAANNAANQADLARINAQSSETQAAAEAVNAANQAIDAGVQAAAALNHANAAANSDSHATEEANRAQLHEQTAYEWAEKLSAPVAPSPPGYPHAVDDGMWSAKFWALWAADIANSFNSIYLGALNAEPTDYNGAPLAAGMMYFNTVDEHLYVHNGTDWVDVTGSGGGGGGASITVSETAPTTPAIGDLWLDPSNMNLYLWFSDGDSSQWAKIAGPNSSTPQIFMSTSPPATAAHGTPWFDTEEGALRIFYDDGDSQQWVTPVLKDTGGPRPSISTEDVVDLGVMRLARVNALPGTPDPLTIYFVT